MLSNERVLRYNPPISLFYVAIALISFTFSLTFFEYSNFLSFKKGNDKNAQVLLNQVKESNKDQLASNSTSIKEEKSVNDIDSKKDEGINKSKEEQNDKKQVEENDDQKKDEQQLKENPKDDKKDEDEKSDKDNKKIKDNKEEDDKNQKEVDEKKSKKEDENENKDKDDKDKPNEDERNDKSSSTIFENGRTFDHLYSKTLNSPLYPKEFPKLEADTEKMEAVKEAFLHAWSNYDEYCFGHDTFRPKSLQCSDSNLGGGLTIIDSISTIIVMGLEKQYKKVRDFVQNKFAPSGSWSLFEFNIRYLGGLLSAYSLSHDEVFKKAAVGIGDAINEVMEKTGGFFSYNFNIKTVDRENYKYSASGSSSSSGYVLAECGTFQLEFFELAEITGDDKYIKSATNVYKKLWNKNPSNGLISSHIGAGTDSYYEYVIKSYIMTGGVGKEMLHRHILLMNDIKSHLVFKTINKKLTGIGLRGSSGRPNPEVEHLATFAGGMIALGSVSKNENHEEDLKLASELATTYAKTYANFKSGIMPEHVKFNTENENDKEDIKMAVDGYILRPETVESIFYLYRFTGDQKYRDYNWQIFKAINRSCRVKHGFTSITHLNSEPEDVKHRDEMESFFLAETLKYLYLTFADSSLISQVDWVFNTEAHPLHIWNKETVEKFANDLDVQISKSLNRERIYEIDRTKRRRDLDRKRRNRENE